MIDCHNWSDEAAYLSKAARDLDYMSDTSIDPLYHVTHFGSNPDPFPILLKTVERRHGSMAVSTGYYHRIEVCNYFHGEHHRYPDNFVQVVTVDNCFLLHSKGTYDPSWEGRQNV